MIANYRDFFISRRFAQVAPLVAWLISVVYLFVVGIKWDFIIKNHTWASAIRGGLLLSLWGAIPYFLLWPIAKIEGRFKALPILTAFGTLAFGLYFLERSRHTPGDAGMSYIVVPMWQMVIAAAVLLGWWLFRTVRRFWH